MKYAYTAASGIILVCYLVSSLVATFIPPKTACETSRRQRICLLITTSAVLGVSLGLCTVRAFQVDRIGVSGDDSLLSDLLYSLMWLVLLLAYLDHPSDVRYPQYGAWVLSVVTRAIILALELRLNGFPFAPLDCASVVLSSCQIVVPCGLLTVYPLLAYTFRTRIEASEEGETEPLLASATADDQTKSDEEDRNSRESPEQKKAREEIHNRPVREYLRSFLIYVPLLWLSTYRQKLYFAGQCVCSLSLRLVNILMPLALGKIIDTLAAGQAPWLPIIGYFALYFAQSQTGIGLVEDYFRLLVTNHQKLALSKAAYDHIMDLSADFQDAKTSSDVWQAMAQATSVITLFQELTFSLAPTILDLAAGFILLWAIFGPYMGLLVLTLMVMMTWVSLRAVKSRVKLSRSWRDSYYDAYHQMVDSTENWFTVAQFGQIRREKTTFSTNQAHVLHERNQLYYWYFRTGFFRYSTLTFAYLLAAALAANEIHNGELKVGAFITLTGYWAQVASPVMYIVHEITDIADKLVDAEKLLVLLEKKPTIVDAPDAKPYDFRGGAVEFRGVSFTYDGKKQATQGLNFKASPGSVTALVGETGGGKSTILKLLMRFYDPEEGNIFIDDQELNKLQLESLRKHVGVVPQEPSMFHTTILDNVRYSDPELSEEQVQEACKAAALHDKIMTFAKGYQTKVGERGCQLSGGEKQRLAIARAILKKPDILLLDEATSSVDSVTESSIQESLDQVCKGRTTFVIAHRLSTILKADLILVIEGGKLVEQGTHAQLIKNEEGVYHKLWKSQLKLQDEAKPSSSATSEDGDKEVLTLVNGSDVAEDEARSPVDGEDKENNPPAKEAAEGAEEISRRRDKTCSESNAVSDGDA
jgi:ABC-type multidrug transport system fused ATPase/permease subunit